MTEIYLCEYNDRTFVYHFCLPTEEDTKKKTPEKDSERTNFINGHKYWTKYQDESAENVKK